jgi:hypothetical protein
MPDKDLIGSSRIIARISASCIVIGTIGWQLGRILSDWLVTRIRGGDGWLVEILRWVTWLVVVPAIWLALAVLTAFAVGRFFEGKGLQRLLEQSESGILRYLQRAIEWAFDKGRGGLPRKDAKDQ